MNLEQGPHIRVVLPDADNGAIARWVRRLLAQPWPRWSLAARFDAAAPSGGPPSPLATISTKSAGQQQQDLGQRVDDPLRLPVIIEPGKMLQQ